MKTINLPIFKSLMLISVLLFSLCSCNAQQENKQTKVKPIELTKVDFLKKVTNFQTNPESWKYLGNKPAIIDFYATWCGPCKRLAPILEEIANEFDGKVVVYKIDCEKEPDLAKQYQIKSIPTLFFVPMKGDPIVVKGALSKDQVKQYIASYL
ncbi:MAG: thioredoxin [Bacteroidales bacterium]|nr:thioredoxin [Bacteroidales bacterium]